MVVLATRAGNALSLFRPRLLVRNGSTHHALGPADAEAFPQESIGSTTWRNFIVWSLVGIGFYKFAPSPGENATITQWIKKISFPREFWAERNSKHAAQSQESAEHTLLVTDAKKERVHRYRYQQTTELASPFRGKVGEY
jgi:hypothetical protein